jgi:penicillin-binding protein A
VNKAISRTFLVIGLLLCALIANVVYIQVIDASDLRSNPQNRGQILQQERVKRGDIQAYDGTVIAGTRREGSYWLRTYPLGDFATHVVGYDSLRYGRAGVEKSMNDVLNGQSSELGVESWIDRVLGRKPRGGTVRLTLVPAVQRAAQQALSGQHGAVVALDPATGAILASASAPTYSAGTLAKDWPRLSKETSAPLLNRAMQALYPPGSSFKVVTAGAGLQDGVVTPQTRYVDTGVYRVYGGKVVNYGGEVFGPNTLTQALTFSINTTFGKLGNQLGHSRLIDGAESFGFWMRPPVELPAGEVRVSGRYRGGTLLSPSAPMDPLGVAWAAVGQERVLATPLQMALVAAGVANGGRVMKPYVVDSVITPQGKTTARTKPATWTVALDAGTAAQLNTMMQEVVKVGTGTAAALAGISVAGKTGTAERGGANQAWFIAFAPADAPRVAVAVTIENTYGTGGEVAAPLAAFVMRAALAQDRLP